MQGAVSKTAYFTGVSEEMIQKERDQILNATLEDMKNLAPLVEAILADQDICVVGSESAIKKEEKRFKEIKPLISC